MHFQSAIPGWHSALLALPDYSLVKSVDNPGLLAEAKLVWAAAGRAPAKLYTLYRHSNVATAPASDWPAAVAWWQAMFARWVDGTYLAQYAPWVDFVSEANEYTSDSTWADPADKARALQNARAASWVWNHDYRGQHVNSADGGQGDIPAACRLALLSGPVANDVPIEIMQLALADDQVIDYHAYSKYNNGQRDPTDWFDHSGRWERMEQAAGLRPTWIFGEGAPYADSPGGWRSAGCLAGDRAAMAASFRQWCLDCQQTDAYATGRLLGPRAWFTSGSLGSWPNYELEADDLLAVSQAISDVWKPGAAAMTLSGVDVSENQLPGLPWAAWHAGGVAFAFVRASIGLNLDSRWAQHVAEATAAGVLCGHYHYLTPVINPASQAAFFMHSIANQPGLAVVDVEQDGLIESQLATFLQEWHAATTRPIAIYTRAGYWNALVSAGNNSYGSYPLWVASYGPGTVTETPPVGPWPTLPHSWAAWQFWQFAGNNGVKPPYTGAIDCDVFNGTLADLQKLFGAPASDPNAAIRQHLADAQAAINAALGLL